MTLTRAALPVLAITAFVAVPATILATAGPTFGYDFQAYLGAAERLLAGRPLYDSGVDVAGGFAIYLYPPPFALAFVPFALLPEGVGAVAWLAVLIASLVAGIALLPVRREVRWVILLLAAVDWPFLYSLKLGQVGPLLFLLFAVAWRAIDRPIALGGAIAAGVLVKVQPVVLFGWALLTRRFRAVAIGVAAVAGITIISTAIVGLDTWRDYGALLARVSSPITTPHNFTPGAVAYQLGAPETVAGVVQVVAVGLAVLAMVVACRIATADASLLVAVVASQLVSPLLWDHYAVVLLLPVAWLLERRQWWAAAIPLVTSLPLIGLTPAVAYPAIFGVCLLALIAVGRAATVATATMPGRLTEPQWGGTR